MTYIVVQAKIEIPARVRWQIAVNTCNKLQTTSYTVHVAVHADIILKPSFIICQFPLANMKSISDQHLCHGQIYGMMYTSRVCDAQDVTIGNNCIKVLHRLNHSKHNIAKARTMRTGVLHWYLDYSFRAEASSEQPYRDCWDLQACTVLWLISLGGPSSKQRATFERSVLNLGACGNGGYHRKTDRH